MPTAVHVARQCLTPDASHALDDAVRVARRRSHAQTTSLHAVSALLASPSSALREACARARNSAYSPRLQFKALDLCLGVSLDRVPSGTVNAADDDPPVSNSLMAAIKRSQANQRRQPENFHLYQQITNQSSVNAVKVELSHLVLSILDDPVVSRVFGEAGFRSSEVKLAILRPLPQFLRYSRPVFLTDDPTRRGFSFPFSASGDENCRRVAEVMGRPKGKNPLLVGVCAYDALVSFIDTVRTKKAGAFHFPAEMAGIEVSCVESDVSRFLIGDLEKGVFDSRLEEVGRVARECVGGGLVVNYGDLGGFVGEEAGYVVARLSRLAAAVDGGRVWLVGAAVSYEMYLKFVSAFPAAEKEWDLQLLPITSLKPGLPESYPKSSLMESFVPFGGFFSAPSEPSLGAYQCTSRCHLCNEKCEQETHTLSKGGFSASVADHYQSTLPSWMQMSELKDLNPKTGDEGMVLSSKISGLQKKWDSICQRLHHSQQFPQPNTYHHNVSRFLQDRNENRDIRSLSNASENEAKSKSRDSRLPIDLHKSYSPRQGFSSPMASEANKNDSFLSKSWLKNSKAEDLTSCSLSNSSVGDGNRASPTSVTSVTTDLGLGMGMGLFSASNHIDPRDGKAIFRALMERVSWQKEAIGVISRTIANRQTRNGNKTCRADIWFNFSGPDRSGKRRIALALSEILYGSSESFIHLDLSSTQESSNYEGFNFRGKTSVDYLASELHKKPLSLVFLENIDKADVLVRSSLSGAITSGKLSDSHGREVSIGNATFVTTVGSTKGDDDDVSKMARGWEVQILIGRHSIFTSKRKPGGRGEVLEPAKRAHRARTSTTTRFLDLNLPAQENEDCDNGNESSASWLRGFLDQVDEDVVFGEFDMNVTSERISGEVNGAFREVLGAEWSLEVDSEVVERLASVGYLSEREGVVEDWVMGVLRRGFVEVNERFEDNNVGVGGVVRVVAREEGGEVGIMGLPARVVVNASV